MEQIEDKVAIVTGGASGIGLAVGRRFGAAGMRVVLADIEEPALDAAVEDLAAAGAQVRGIRCDVSDRGDVEKVADFAEAEFGAVHVAFNNAGVGAGGLTWEIPVEDWEWVLGVNLWGVIHGISVFTPRIIAAGGGHIVNTASAAGLTSPMFMSPYNVSKHSVVTMSETMFQELSMMHPEVGISVLCPGWVRTQIHKSDRNRVGPHEPPASLGADGETLPPLPDGAPEIDLAGVLEDVISSGLEPAEVADRVLDAILTRRFYILTHPDWNPMVTDRADRIVSGQDPAIAALPQD